MIKKQTIKIAILALIVASIAGFALSANTYAAECGGVTTSIIDCPQPGGNTVENSGIWGILLVAINILTAGVGIAAVGGIVYASIMYTSAGGNQEQVKKAMTVITNIVIGIIAYAGMYTLLNFIVPGGVFQ